MTRRPAIFASLLASILVSAAVVSWALGQQPREPSPVSKAVIQPYDVSITIEYLRPGEEAVCTVIGDGTTALGVYAFDALGRCVAFDDEPSRIIDDRAVAWRVTDREPYEIHVRNFGPRANQADVSFRSLP